MRVCSIALNRSKVIYFGYDSSKHYSCDNQLWATKYSEKKYIETKNQINRNRTNAKANNKRICHCKKAAQTRNEWRKINDFDGLYENVCWYNICNGIAFAIVVGRQFYIVILISMTDDRYPNYFFVYICFCLLSNFDNVVEADEYYSVVLVLCASDSISSRHLGIHAKQTGQRHTTRRVLLLLYASLYRLPFFYIVDSLILIYYQRYYFALILRFVRTHSSFPSTVWICMRCVWLMGYMKRVWLLVHRARWGFLSSFSLQFNWTEKTTMFVVAFPLWNICHYHSDKHTLVYYRFNWTHPFLFYIHWHRSLGRYLSLSFHCISTRVYMCMHRYLFSASRQIFFVLL